MSQDRFTHAFRDEKSMDAGKRAYLNKTYLTYTEIRQLNSMKLYAKTLKQIRFWMWLSIVAIIMTHGSAAFAQNRSAAPAGSTPAAAAQRFVSIDFNDVDISVFIKFVSELTGKNFVVDNRVKGKVTIISPTKISVDEAYKVFESVLEVHGFSTVQAGEITKIVPAPEARTKNIQTLIKQDAVSPEDKVVTRLIPLTYADPDELKRLFAPLISKNSVMLSYPPTNMLIVTDVSSNINRLLRIMKVIDVTGIGQEVSVIPLEYSEAANLVKVLTTVFAPTQAVKKGISETQIRFVADERTNAIVLKASEVDSARVKSLITMLDKETPRGTEKIRVYYLENAIAEDLAEVLQDLPTKKSADTKGKPTTPVVSENVRISADKATNSLIIMAEKEDYQVLEEVIKKLDIPRAMVYIESLIMEVNMDKSFDVGTDWRVLADTTVNGGSGVSGGGFGSVDVTDLSTADGFSLGIVSGALDIVVDGVSVTLPNIGAIINAFKSDTDVNILSTPQVLTTDHEEATIVIGKNIPYQTRSAADSGVETYSSYEYKDVGITLKITPHITKDRFVRLVISQEVTKLVSDTSTSDRPTTLKRTVDTTVIVQDKNTVVIGGLIDDSVSNTTDTVPCLGQIPLLGWAFKSMSNTREKTNLYVFLTPHVIKNPAEAREIYLNKKDQIDKLQKGQIKMYREKNEPEPDQMQPDAAAPESLPSETTVQ